MSRRVPVVAGSTETLLTNIVTIIIIITMTKKRVILWVCASVFFVYLTLLASSALYMHLESSPYHWLGQDTTTAWPSTCNASNQSRDDSGESYNPGDKQQWRVRFGDGPGASVRGWPAKGGYYALYSCLAVELDFLGLDRFKEADRPQNSSTADEEAHCNRMRQLGAKWWASHDEESMWWLLNMEDGRDWDNPAVYFGWPAHGGVWVLNTAIFNPNKMGVGRIHNAITMEERCVVMEDLGAVYYSTPEDCPLLDLSDEPVAGA